MSPLAYAVALRTLALWTSGQVTESEAQLAWNELASSGYTTVNKPSRKDWPNELRRPQGDNLWGSWQHILAAISPAGFLALMLGDEDFRAGLEKSVEQAKSAIASGLGFTLGLMLALASVGALGVGVMAARAQGDRRRR